MALALHHSGFHFQDLEHAAVGWLQDQWAGMTKLLALWQRRIRERQELASLDDHMLSDIGLNRADVWREVHKPFWRA